MNSEALVAACAGLFTFLVTWGAMKSTVASQQKQIDELKVEAQTRCPANCKALNERITTTEKELGGKLFDMHSIYVTHQHFNEVILSLRDAQKDMRDDIKRILELLTSRHGA